MGWLKLLGPIAISVCATLVIFLTWWAVGLKPDTTDLPNGFFVGSFLASVLAFIPALRILQNEMRKGKIIT
jgi:hypothetical protein